MIKKLSVIFIVLSVLISMPAMAETPEDIIEDYTYGGTFTIARTQPPEGMFNPLFAETVYDIEIEAQLFEGLTRIDPSFEPQPDLALDWDVSDDFLTYTFYLDEDAEFHDGEPVTAHDVKYTYEAFLHPDYDGVRASNFIEIKGAEEFQEGETDDLEGVTVIDEHTVEIEFAQIHAPFLVQGATYGIVPKHILDEYEVAELSDIEFNHQNPVGSGPFEFVEYQDDEYAHLTAFENYREGRPFLDDVIIEYVDDQAQIMMIDRGEIDYAPEIDQEHFDRLTEIEHINLHKSIRNGCGYIGFNVESESSVSEAAVRQAATYGINRQGFIDAVLNGLAVTINSPVSQASWAYAEGLTEYQYDPEMAQQVLKEDGWEKNEDGIFEKNGRELSFTVTASSDSDFIDQLMALIQDNLTDIGMDVTIERMEFNTLFDLMQAGEIDAWFLGVGFGVDPDPYYRWHSESARNDTNFTSDRVDELIEKGRRTVNQEDRRQYYQEFQEIWNEQMPWIPIYADIYLHVFNERVRGYNPDPGTVDPLGSDWHLLREIWIPERYR